MDTGAEDTGAEDLGVADGGIPTLDLAGYQLQNQEQGNQVATLPSGTILVPGDVVIIARDATQSDFEAEWGVRLAANVHFLSTGAANTGAPIVNGGEQWALVSASGVLVDGVTIAGQAGHSYQRLSGSDPSAPDAWLDQSDLLGTPGTASLPAHLGLVISEWSDRTGNGKFGYEFVELWYDP